MSTRISLTHTELLSLVHYDKSSGLFTSLVKRKRVRAGQVLGCVNGKGYVQFSIHSVLYTAHRLAWFYVTGGWPEAMIDHKDTNRSNNAFANLRLATYNENLANASISKRNTTGKKGVTFDKSRGKFRAQIMVAGKRQSLGMFLSLDDASDAYDRAALALSGSFALTNESLCVPHNSD